MCVSVLFRPPQIRATLALTRLFARRQDALVEPFVKETVPRYLGQFEAFFAARAVKDGFLLSATTVRIFSRILLRSHCLVES